MKMKMANKSVETGTSQLLVRYYDHNDEGAITEFFQNYKELVFRIAYSVLRNPADADDIMQQTFVQVIKKQSICKAAYDADNVKVKSWLLSIVYNYSRMHLRSQKVKQIYSLEEERKYMPIAEAKHSNDDTDSDHTEVSLKLKSAIFNLPEKYRVPILMRYHEEMSIEDISKTLAVNSSTIRSLLSRGVNLLKNKLSSEKVKLSSTAAIEMIAFIPYPVSQKAISLSYLNSLAAAKTTSAKIAVVSQPKTYIFLKSILAVALITSASAFLFVTNKNKTSVSPMIQTTPDKTLTILENKATSKTSWDFSKEDGSKLKLVFSNLGITHNPELNTITNEKKGVNNQPVINLEIKATNFTKIHSKWKLLLSDFKGKNPINNFSLEFILLKENKPIKGSYLYHRPEPFQLMRDFKEMSCETDLYIIDNIITHKIKNQGFVNIIRFDNLDNNTEIGLLISGVYVETISIEKMAPEEVEEIRKQTAAVLNAQKK